jgi:N-acetylglucosamine kinase-like BadF-type ATPase
VAHGNLHTVPAARWDGNPVDASFSQEDAELVESLRPEKERMSGYYIGIDGGSTASTGLLAESDLRVLHRASAGCANYHLVGLRGAEETLLTLTETLSLAAGVRLTEIAGFCFALSGVSRADDFKAIQNILRHRGMSEKSKLIPDFEAALLGGTSNEAALVVISGTGSVVFGRNRSGETKKVCGHGHLIGDPGSGYDIGIRALRALIAFSEGRGQQTTLTRNMLNEIPLKTEEDIVPWLYSVDTPKRAIAGLAPVVIRCAKEGDGVAAEILHSAAGELADVAAFTAARLGLAGEHFDVVLSGGVLENSAAYFDLMQSIVLKKMPTANPMRPINEPAFGALVALLGRPVISPAGRPDEKTGAKADSVPPA